MVTETRGQFAREIATDLALRSRHEASSLSCIGLHGEPSAQSTWRVVVDVFMEQVLTCPVSVIIVDSCPGPVDG